MQIKFHRSGYTIVELLVVLLILGIAAAILLPVFTRARETHCGPSCSSHLKQLGLAMLQYSQDHNERLPPLASNAVASSVPSYAQPYGWADAIHPYVRNLDVYQCSAEANKKSVEDATQSGFTDYWLNTNLSARPLKYIPEPVATFMMGEGNDGHDGSDARYNRNSLPQRWINDENSPARRHLGTGNYLYADGHVKALGAGETITQNRFAVVKP